MIDILHEVSGGIFSTDLERYIQIDIDDMFVGSEGTRIIKSDVDAMIEFQEKWDPVVPGVHFVIGFSGKFFQRSNNTMENQGDEYILGNWFSQFLKSLPPNILTGIAMQAAACIMLTMIAINSTYLIKSSASKKNQLKFHCKQLLALYCWHLQRILYNLISRIQVKNIPAGISMQAAACIILKRLHFENQSKKRHLHSDGFLICGVIWNQVDLNRQKYCANI